MSGVFWIAATLLCLVGQGFFSMVELAMVCFNRLYLNYFIANHSRSAKWIAQLLENPHRLFTTTLFMVNVFLQIGSECSRQVYAAFDLSSNIAPLTQVVLVVIVAEMSPMFAAKRYSEKVALFGAPVIYLTSCLIYPLSAFIGMLTRFLKKDKNDKASERLFTREDLKMALISVDDELPVVENSLVDAALHSIFSLRRKTVSDIMQPLYLMPRLPASTSVKEARARLLQSGSSCILVYERISSQVTGVVLVSHLISASDNKPLKRLAIAPYFVSYRSSLFSLLNQLRENKQKIAVVLDQRGSPTGCLSLQDLMNEIMGHYQPNFVANPKVYLEKTFSGQSTLQELSQDYSLLLDGDETQTLASFLEMHLGHPPEEGESLTVQGFEFKVEKENLLGPESILIRTLQ